MSEKMTQIGLRGPGHGAGLANWGDLPLEEMIRQYRAKARRDLLIAEAILAASDEDFHIRVVRGPSVQHHIKTLQEGKK